jgi:magnesium-transporting ATPase (P-type)
VLFGIIIFGISPIGAAALLWINFVTDFLVTLAFSGETASSTLSLRRHESRELLNIRGAAGIAVPAVIMSALTIIAYADGLSTSSGAAAALAFTVMSVCETTHAFTLSHTYTVFQKGTIRNLVMPLACLLSTAITLLVALTPVGALLSFEPFGGSGWLMVIIAAAVTLITGEVIKFINKKYAK